MSNLAQDAALAEVRLEIDDIDQQIQELINRRATCAQRVADIKHDLGADSPVFYRPEREAQVLRKAQDRNQGPLPNHEIARLFREVMSICLAHEHRLNIGYCSSDNAEADKASLKQFGHSVKPFALESVAELFTRLDKGSLHYALISLVDFSKTTDVASRLRDSKIHVIGEVCLSETAHYIVLGKQWVGPSGDDKTAFLLSGLDECLSQTLREFGLERFISIDDSTAYVEVQGSISLDDFLLQLDCPLESLSVSHLGCFPRAVF